MKNQYIYIAIGIALIILGYMFRDTLLPQKEVPNPVVETDTPTPGRVMSIESYVSANISILSPIKETVGGTFFVTSIQAANGTGVVSYEDGHNAYTADFTYTIDERTGITIIGFGIRE